MAFCRLGNLFCFACFVWIKQKPRTASHTGSRRIPCVTHRQGWLTRPINNAGPASPGPAGCDSGASEDSGGNRTPTQPHREHRGAGSWRRLSGGGDLGCAENKIGTSGGQARENPVPAHSPLSCPRLPDQGRLPGGYG